MDDSKTVQAEPKNVETGREIFIRLANNRVNKILSSLEVLKKLSSRKSSYNEKDVLLMKKHLHAAVDDAIDSFAPSSKSAKKGFSLHL